MGDPRLLSSNGKDATDGKAREYRSVPVQLVRQAGPSIVAVAVMLSLIFGGCCSNVKCPLNPGSSPWRVQGACVVGLSEMKL